MIDDSTAHFLLTTIVQSIAAIWAIFFGLFIVFRERILELRGNVQHPRGNVHLDDFIKGFLVLINIYIFLTLFFGIFGFVLFKNIEILSLSVTFFIVTILLLVVYFTQFIIRKL